MVKKSSNWYGVKLIYINKVLGEPEAKLIDENYVSKYMAYEESVLIIEAESFEIAYEKAEYIAKQNEDEYQNIYGQTVVIRYFNSVDCYFIDNTNDALLQDGLEVYSNILETSFDIAQEKFLRKSFPINLEQKYMLLNNEFSGSK